ncbi:MAG: DUF4266 domain-containing protein [Myxococcales bacterium]|nr:DUF4266 domain-containing protein [Myxococcales bacterium]MDD9968092.1 DUF4266 domain-containing protein [Myxococcales bacterium]
MPIPRFPRAAPRRVFLPPARTLLALTALAMFAGCAHVAPYEREYLSRRSMDTNQREQAEQRFWAHVSEAREGAGGAGQSAGGGCGCN